MFTTVNVIDVFALVGGGSGHGSTVFWIIIAIIAVIAAAWAAVFFSRRR